METLVHESNDAPQQYDPLLNGHELAAEQLVPTESAYFAAAALDRLDAQPIEAKQLSPKETVLGGGADVENQEFEFIKTHQGTRLTFKLTGAAYERALETVRSQPDSHWRRIVYSREGKNVYTGKGEGFVADGLNVVIAYNDQGWRALDGLVSITPADPAEPIDNLDFGMRLDNMLRTKLGIEDAFTPPDSQEDATYKSARYAWHHKYEDGDEPQVPLDRLKREEVFPGYSTIVEPGKTEEYERKHGEFALIHSVSSDRNIPQLLRVGLAATHERYKRGVLRGTLTSEEDLQTGGGDSVFVRTVTERSLREDQDGSAEDQTIIVIKPNVMDRTDWYAYDHDRYGTTDPRFFKDRLTPDQLLETINERGWNGSLRNEEMFRTGISVESFAAIAVGSEEHKQNLVASLQQQSITEVNGRPVDEFIQVAGRMSQIIDVAHGREPRVLASTGLTYDNNWDDDTPEPLI